MVLVVASILSGLTLGGTYALVSLGLVLAFRATGTFNFAHGELMLLPAFVVGYFTLHHLAVGLGIAVALAVSAAVGALFYLLVLRRTTGLPLFVGIIATFGLAAILDGIMGIMFRAIQYEINFPGLPTGNVTILGAAVSDASLVVAGFTICLALAVNAVLRFTHLGIMIRAAGHNSILASQCGIPVRWVYIGSWSAASVLAALGGISYGSVTIVNTSLVNLGLAAIPAIVIGGIDSIEGAIVGGLVVGLVEGFTQIYLGGNYVDLVTYLGLLLVLLIRPQGIFGTREVVRA